MAKLTEKQEEALKEIKRLAKDINDFANAVNNVENLTNDWLMTSIDSTANCIKYKVEDFNEADTAPHANVNPAFQNVLNSFL